MHRALGALVALSLVAGQASWAQHQSGGEVEGFNGLTGTLASFTDAVGTARETAVTVATGEVFVLTQVCYSGGGDLICDISGGLELPRSSVSGTCREFLPGLVVPAQRDLGCRLSSGTGFFSVSGVMTKPAPSGLAPPSPAPGAAKP